MLKPLACCVLAGAMLVCAPGAYAQGANAALSFNPRDLSGYWLRNTVRPRLDEYGNPKSFDARFAERYRRTGPDTIEGELTIYDPKNFTAPWTHPKSTFRRMLLKDVTFFGWKGLFSGVTDAICAPINEIDDFNKRFRDPAINGK